MREQSARITPTAPTMNPVEHALLLFDEYFRSTTTRERSVEILDDLLAIALELDDAQKDELNTRGNEMAERYR